MGDGRRALLISSPPAGRRRGVVVRALGRAGFRVLTPDRPEQATPDLIVALGTIAVLAQVKLMRAAAPRVPIIVAWLGRPQERFVTAAYAAGATSVVPAEHVDTAWNNLLRVLGGSRRAGAAPRAHESFVAGFHEPTGRLDAARVARTMGLTLSQVARAIGVTPSALSKRPAAGAAQAGLRELESAWAMLLDMLGGEELARAWLHAGHPDFSGRPPLAYLSEGGARRLADYLRAAVAGEAA